MKKRILNGLWGACLVAGAISAHGTTEELMKGWEYYRGDLGGPWEALRTDKKTSRFPAWEKVQLPHCFNAIDSVDPYTPYYQGPGWYRFTLTPANPYADGRTLLRFDGAGQKTKLPSPDTTPTFGALGVSWTRSPRSARSSE